MKNDVILKVVSYVLLPVIMVSGLYVQFHGDISPGGGFQAGAILASGMILSSWMVNSKALSHMLNLRVMEIGSSLGLFMYAFVGIVSMLKGGNFLDYSIFFAKSTALGQEVGVFFVELGVCITVFSTLLMIYLNMNNLLENGSK